MKKILTFAIMALLMGGFAFNANAQDRTAKPQKKAVIEKKADKPATTDMEKTLKQFEQAVDKCVSLHKALQNQGDNAKNATKEFNAALAKAETLKSNIEKAKDGMSRSQVDRFQKAVAKLSQVYIK